LFDDQLRLWTDVTDTFDRLKAALADRYTLEREIGSGGMATVYLAQDLRHDRKVAIKVLRPDLAASLGSERFLREIRIAAKLTHPHILPLHDSGEADGFLYYVMPYIDGESLRDKLTREGELPIHEAVRFLREVVDALALAHKQGIVHRDIKPDNVLLSEDHGLVTDFGVAKAVTEATAGKGITSFGMAVGTPAYMSPEQASGDPNIDHRADIYAVGAMAYEMLTGRPPFQDGSPQTVLAKHVTEPARPVTELREAVPPPLATVVMRCLEKRPADRWQSAAELRTQLDALTTPTGPVTPADMWVSGGTLEAQLRRSHPARVMGLYGIGTALVVLVAYSAMVLLGLPEWVVPATIVTLAAGLPLALLTGRAERRRAVARAGTDTFSDGLGRIHRWLTWKRAMTAGGIALGALTVVVAAYMAMRALGIGPVGTLVASGVLEERERIVLAQFENRSGDSTIGETVTELFRIDLTQSRSVTVLERAQVGRVLARMERDPDELLTPTLAAEVAEREGLKAIVTGEILPVGNGFVVSSRLTAAGTGEVLWAGRESANDPSGIIKAVDDLSASLRAKIGESLRTIRADAPLAEVTTSSTEALRKYAQADRANNQADFDRATALLEEAIAADSAFAMAYRKLGIILTNQQRDPERASQAFTRAFELRDRLTERERYLAEAAYHRYVADDNQASIDAYRTLLEKYPTDRIALNNLAVNYGALGRKEEAAELYLRSIALGGAPSVTFGNAIEALYGLGQRDSARAVLERFQSEYPDQPQMTRYRAGFLSAVYDYEAAETLMRGLRDTQRGSPAIEAMAGAELAAYAAVQGRVVEAWQLILELYDLQEQHGFRFIDQPRPVFETIGGAALSLRYYGNADSALRALDRLTGSAAWRGLEPADREYPGLASLYAEAGRPERARALLDQYESEVGQETRARTGELIGVHDALGSLALAEGRPADAVEEYRSIPALVPQCVLCGMFETGRAYDAAGMADSAIAVYERYLASPVLFRSGQDNLTLWWIFRRLGALYEETGNREQAIEYYNRFVNLWQNADADLQPQVQEIRERLASLVSEQR
jgi:tetratricopeptide (TPR) repeat protein/tRNA A-37 threonylcarbamoyl transferase component Bud32